MVNLSDCLHLRFLFPSQNLMKKLCIAAITAAISLGFYASSCTEQNPIAQTYTDSAKLTEKPATWSNSQPQLANVTDSASYLMGYIFGGNLNRMIEANRMPELKEINRTEFERGVAMALQADSSQLDMLYGMIFALDLRHNLTKMTQARNLKWNRTLTYRGFYQGFNNTIPNDMPLPVAEDDLNQLLYPTVTDGQELEF